VPIGVVLLLLAFVLDAPALFVIGGGLIALRFGAALLPWDAW
jgi:hypothetical protein